jgi:hypothetical protein
VRVSLHAGETAPAEVEHEELHLERRRGQRDGRQERAREGGLAAERSTDDRDVPSRSAERDGEALTALLQGHVDDAEGTVRAPDSRHAVETSPRPSTTARSGMSASSEAGSDSGGSHT